MTAALADLAGKANSEGIANLMTAQGAVGLRQWYPSATQLDRDRYFGSLRSMKPFFLFDAAPLIVVYARTDEGVQVLYFMSDANGKLLWTNSSHQSIGDEIFKKGALFAAATAERPFQALAISVR
jgi:hypothetical protein